MGPRRGQAPGWYPNYVQGAVRRLQTVAKLSNSAAEGGLRVCPLTLSHTRTVNNTSSTSDPLFFSRDTGVNPPSMTLFS